MTGTTTFNKTPSTVDSEQSIQALMTTHLEKVHLATFSDKRFSLTE